MIGGRGSDWVTYGLSPGEIEVDLAAGIATGWGTDRLRSIENAQGSPFSDLLLGDVGPNVLRGGSGEDELRGGGGPDVLWGGPDGDEMWGQAGNDHLIGHTGRDNLDGGWGNDELEGRSDSDTFYPGPGDDVVRGGSGLNTLDFEGLTRGVVVDLASGVVLAQGRDSVDRIHFVWGTDHADVIRAGTAPLDARGLDGDDLLIGGPQDDLLYGGPGTDVIDGGGGDDYLVASSGGDTLRGRPRRRRNRIRPRRRPRRRWTRQRHGELLVFPRAGRDR